MALYRNQKLFSDYYLNELLPETSFWEEVKKDKLQEIFNKIKAIYQMQKSSIPDLNESQLEEKFIRPVLRSLGHIYEVNVPLPRTYEGLKRPDYAFYSSEKTKKAGVSEAIAIGEAKRYGRPLDRRLKTEKDPFEAQNPSLQISRYLWISEAPWGILTDGRYWRLYERETSKRLEIFYEINLFRLLEEGTLDEFKYFYLLFRKKAFPDFLRKIYNESIEYAKAVGEELKDNVYKALKVLAEGFLKTSTNNLCVEDLKEIQDNCHIFLYRLLFIFYAEARRLLPLNNQMYKISYSLYSIRNEIKEKIDKRESFSPIQLVYCDRLKTLFDLVNKGSELFGIPKDDMYVPPYNGGLFDTTKHSFIEKYKVADKWMMEIIDLLASSPSQKNSRDRAFVDYGSLDVRHIGSIYEGLLEYKLKIAKSDLVAIKEKGKETWKSKEEVKSKKIIDEVSKGNLYCITDKGERKVTGSYYTPGYIVEYIVEHTLGPVIEEKKKIAMKMAEGDKKMLEVIKKEISALKAQVSKSTTSSMKSIINEKIGQKEVKLKELEIKTSQSSILIDEILKIKVLDPAMGSGHFLVEATDYLARALVETLSGEITPKQEALIVKEKPATYEIKTKEVEENDFRWAKREIVEKCIYGVDSNPLAVELAKLSLWLSTVAKDKPLSFLDHHLRCGNSLIGVKTKDLKRLPIKKKKKKEETLPLALHFDEEKIKLDLGFSVGDLLLIGRKTSDKVEDIKEKDKIYKNLRKSRIEKWQKVADLWTSSYFGLELEPNIYNALYDFILDKSKGIPQKWVNEYLKNAQGIAEQKQFFHWELEFPEIFFDEHGREKDNPGFNVVVGNPPYDVISEKEQKRDVEKEKSFFEMSPQYNFATGGKLNFYRLFVALSLGLLNKNGLHGFIVPMALLGDKQSKFIRKHLLTQSQIEVIEAFPQKDDPQNRVFVEAKLSTCVYIVKKAHPTLFTVRIHPGREILDTSPTIKLGHIQLKEFDSDNLSIPAYPRMTDKDFRLALKLISKSKGAKLCNWVSSQQGEVNLTAHAPFLSTRPIGQVVLRGAHINRYVFNEKPKQGIPKYLNVEKFLDVHRLNTKAYDYQYVRIGYQRGSAIDNWRRIIATIINPGNFCSDTINYIVKPKELNLFMVLALLNSALWEWRFRLTSTNNHVNSYEIDNMPTYRISFTTSSNKRKQHTEEVKGLYKVYLKSYNWDSILFFVHQRLSAKPEESDVVHDILAYLAEKMIEYNKDKNRETKSFLKYLEREIGTGVEDLVNKITIKNYHEYDIEKLLSILKRNKKKLKIDPTRRKFQDKITEEFTKSITELVPLKQKIDTNDKLINQIVYKLYGLIEEEIKIVEEVVKK